MEVRNGAEYINMFIKSLSCYSFYSWDIFAVINIGVHCTNGRMGNTLIGQKRGGLVIERLRDKLALRGQRRSSVLSHQYCFYKFCYPTMCRPLHISENISERYISSDEYHGGLPMYT